MGPRFSPRISRTEKIADAFSRCPNHGADCDRNRTSARRYHQATKAASAALLCREFQPSEPDLSRSGEIIVLPTSARVHPGNSQKQRRFSEEKSESEQLIAHEQLRTMVAYAETRHCRRATLLRYFGESWPPVSVEAGVSPASARRSAADTAATTEDTTERGEISCNGCDNCLEPRETFDGTIPAQKLLSCVHRVQARQGFGFGLNHIVEVLIGGTNDAIKKRGHDQLSTFGIGADLKREQWQRIGRELLRLGLLEAAPGKFATLSVTDAGMMALRKRTPITLTKPIESPAKKVRTPRAGEIECDEKLFERLRALRRKIADERDVPAYIIFSDATLRQMAQARPQSKSKFAQIAGVGQQKLKEFAEPFLAEIGEYLRSDLAMAASSRMF